MKKFVKKSNTGQRLDLGRQLTPEFRTAAQLFLTDEAKLWRHPKDAWAHIKEVGKDELEFLADVKRHGVVGKVQGTPEDPRCDVWFSALAPDYNLQALSNITVGVEEVKAWLGSQNALQKFADRVGQNEIDNFLRSCCCPEA